MTLPEFKINQGAISQPCPFPVEQLRYMGGGHPGCGGTVNALRLTVDGRDRFVVQEYRDDCDGQRYRFREVENAETARRALDHVWPDVALLRDCEWQTIPWWESAETIQRGLE